MRRGFTLVEVLVVTIVFTLLAFLLLAIYQVSVRAHNKEDARDRTYRASMLGLEHVKEALRGCQLLEPQDPTAGPVSAARFRYPELDESGVFVVDNRGEPVWAGTADLVSGPNGSLVLTRSDGTTRVLAELGEEGGATFRRLDDHRLELAIVAVRAGQDLSRSSRSELRAHLALPNQ